MSSTTEHYEKLLTKYLDGQCNAAETAELYNWLQASGSHRALLKTMQEEFQKALESRQGIPVEVSDRIETRLLQSISKTKTKLSNLWYYAAAASIAAAVLLFILLKQPAPALTTQPAIAATAITPGTNKAILTLSNGSTVILDSAGNQVIAQGATTVLQKNGQLQYASKANNEATVYNTLTVPRGGQFNIILPDGSHVWLNAASSLRYPISFNGKDRRVDITGQGYFEVTPNAKQPFIVQVNNMEVQVLGTSFDIMAYSDEKSVNTTLIQGAVKVNDKRLFPGQQALMDPTTGNITIREADVEQVIAWKTGFFEFDNARLSDILRQLSRWYDIDINYKQTANEKLLGGRISRSLPLSDILHMLEANGPVFELVGRKLTVK
ncbi:FecR domain-containing protein [Chitinophaga sp.]|uniref:FecR domain-containing protein n=1 Tax=Chitinophaga sp. TaxID=1869181 RepID=UPI0031CF5742